MARKASMRFGAALLWLAVVGAASIPKQAQAVGDILYIADAASGYIKRFNAKTGEFIDNFIKEKGIVEGLACVDDKLYVVRSAQASEGRIETYDWRTGAPLGSFATGLDYAQAIDPSPNGALLYCAEYGTNRVLAFDRETGALLYETPYQEAFGVTVTKDGKVYVSGKVGGGVDIYDEKLNFVRNFVAPGDHGIQRPLSVDFGPDGTAYVLDSFGNAVYNYDANGNYIRKLTTDDPFDLDKSFDSAIGSDGNLYVVSGGAQCVTRFYLDTGKAEPYIPPGTPGDYPKFMLFDTEHILSGTPPPSDVPEAGDIAVVALTSLAGGSAFLYRRRSKKRVDLTKRNWS